jgi:hypothetical protein
VLGVCVCYGLINGQMVHRCDNNVGAATILAGVGIVMIPQFMSGPAGAGARSDNQPLFNMIFLCANIPMALSSVYKEVAFKHDDIDVNYLQVHNTHTPRVCECMLCACTVL